MPARAAPAGELSGVVLDRDPNGRSSRLLVVLERTRRRPGVVDGPGDCAAAFKHLLPREVPSGVRERGADPLKVRLCLNDGRGGGANAGDQGGVGTRVERRGRHRLDDSDDVTGGNDVTRIQCRRAQVARGWGADDRSLLHAVASLFIKGADEQAAINDPDLDDGARGHPQSDSGPKRGGAHQGEQETPASTVTTTGDPGGVRGHGGPWRQGGGWCAD
ncbi:MAG: hypothetical protein Q8O67_25670 [Deltaproteobacteria bacterium]|nr:hypothetical protein [Deltaproteobacteria bacterium]